MHLRTTKHKKLFDRLWLSLLIALPVVLWLLPSDFFDNGSSLCLSRSLFNKECIGCGITRAVMHLHHFEWREAMAFNKMSVIVYPLLVIIWCGKIIRQLKNLEVISLKKAV